MKNNNFLARLKASVLLVYISLSDAVGLGLEKIDGLVEL
jgi:hypothetical protein